MGIFSQSIWEFGFIAAEVTRLKFFYESPRDLRIRASLRRLLDGVSPHRELEKAAVTDTPLQWIPPLDNGGYRRCYFFLARVSR